MSVWALLASCACAAGAFVVAGCGQHVATFPTVPSGAPTLQTLALPSPLTPLDPAMGARVYLPPGYNPSNPDKRYPVVLVLPDYGGDENTMADLGYPQVADALIRRGEIAPLILVFPRPGRSYPGDGTSFYADSDFGLYETWITDTLLPALGTNYNVDETRVGVSGHSMGGYGAMRLALRHPSLLRSVVAHSGLLDLETLLEPTLLSRFAIENSDVVAGQRVYEARIDLARLGERGPLTPLLVSLSADVASITASAKDTLAWGQDLSLDPVPHDPYRYPVQLVSAGTWRGFHTPIILDADDAGTPAVVPDVWERFQDNDPSTMLARLAADDGAAWALFRSLAIALDCGTSDDADPTDDGLGIDAIAQCDAFDAELTALGVAHTYVRYAGTHTSRLYDRIADDLRHHSRAFGGPPFLAPAAGAAARPAARANQAVVPARAAATVRRSPSASVTPGR